MEVTVHSVYDKYTNTNKVFGIGDEGYDLAMDFMKTCDFRRYEYFSGEENIQIMWDMTEEQCRNYVRNMLNPGEGFDSEHDYCGAMFFGAFKLEFITTPDGNYHNLFRYGTPGYDFLDDGTPYSEEYCPEKFYDYARRTFDAFARKIEEQLVPWLNEYTQFIDDAVLPTNPAKWYTGRKAQYMQKITKE